MRLAVNVQHPARTMPNLLDSANAEPQKAELGKDQ